MTTTTAPYDALTSGTKRRSARRRVVPEDKHLTESRRTALAENGYDVWRNFGLLGWAIRQTLDYCCMFDFQPRTGDDGLNRDLRFLMERDTSASRVDVFGRMDWDDMRRVSEAQKILAIDAFYVQMRDRTLQLIEGAYCKDPLDVAKRRKNNGERWLNGAKLNKRGRVVAWNFREVNPVTGSDERDRDIRAGRVWQHCQFDVRPNVIRPQQPMTAHINGFRDLQQILEAMRAKVNTSQFFGVVLKRKVDSDDEEFEDDEELKVDRKPGANNTFNIEPDEAIETVESNHPAQSVQEFVKLMIQDCLSALDIPYSFFNEAFTNFSGSRLGWLRYERACTARRKTQQRLHRKMTMWRLNQWTLPEDLGGTGELSLPSGMSLNQLPFKWVPRGVAWWKPKEELDTDLRAYAAGLKSLQDIADEHGLGDVRENIREILAEREAIADGGLDVVISNNALVKLEATGSAA